MLEEPARQDISVRAIWVRAHIFFIGFADWQNPAPALPARSLKMGTCQYLSR